MATAGAHDSDPKNSSLGGRVSISEALSNTWDQVGPGVLNGCHKLAALGHVHPLQEHVFEKFQNENLQDGYARCLNIVQTADIEERLDTLCVVVLGGAPHC